MNNKFYLKEFQFFDGEDTVVFNIVAVDSVHLSVAELVYLNEKGIRPSSELLYSYNRQKLTETIYFQNNIQDNILEVQMEKAATRDETIKNILSLLKKKRILLL